MSDQQTKPAAAAAAHSPMLKLLIEVGPLVAFFAAYGRAGIYWATGVLMVATVIALLASWRLLGKISAVPVVTAVLVVIFGGLTFALDDPRFIKMKPTVMNLLFAVGLIIGVAQKGLDLTTAARTFTVLTIGEGLVSQVPALVISISATTLVAVRQCTNAVSPIGPVKWGIMPQ